jgi:hypothetical protein
MDFESNRARCLEEVCSCLQTSMEKTKDVKKALSKEVKDKCICDALQIYVTDCLAADYSINIQGWRAQMNCRKYLIQSTEI